MMRSFLFVSIVCLFSVTVFASKCNKNKVQNACEAAGCYWNFYEDKNEGIIDNHVDIQPKQGANHVNEGGQLNGGTPINAEGNDINLGDEKVTETDLAVNEEMGGKHYNEEGAAGVAGGKSSGIGMAAGEGEVDITLENGDYVEAEGMGVVAGAEASAGGAAGAFFEDTSGHQVNVAGEEVNGGAAVWAGAAGGEGEITVETENHDMTVSKGSGEAAGAGTASGSYEGYCSDTVGASAGAPASEGSSGGSGKMGPWIIALVISIVVVVALGCAAFGYERREKIRMHINEWFGYGRLIQDGAPTYSTDLTVKDEADAAL